jgi:hypothetical protein
MSSATKTCGGRGLVSILVCCCAVCWLAALGSTVEERREPIKSMAGIQFDAVLSIESPAVKAPVFLFVRYWVTAQYYQLAVVWAEPHGRGLDFPLYPPTLLIGSNPHEFRVHHSLKPNLSQAFEKPIGNRGNFGRMFGDYPIADIRFGEQEALSQRIYASDLPHFRDQAEDVEQTIQLKPHTTGTPNPRAFSLMKIRSNGSQIKQIDLLGKNREAVKSIEYEYTHYKGSTRLCRQKITLAQAPGFAELPGRGVTVTLGESKYQLKELPIQFHRGGRTADVEYIPVALESNILSLPESIRVHSSSKRMSRSARLVDFRPMDLTYLQAQDAATKYAGFTQEHRDYRQLLVKYWKKNSSDVSVTDVVVLRRLREHFRHVPVGIQESIGEELRRFNILMELSRLLGDEHELERHFGRYLRALQRNALSELVLAGGYCAVNTSMLWLRPEEANRLLTVWVRAAVEACNIEDVLRFSNNEVQRGNLWCTAQLLEHFLRHSDFAPGTLFEIAALRCLALRELEKLIMNPNAKGNVVADAEIHLTRTLIGVDGLHDVAANSFADAQRTLKLVGTLTENQSKLKARLGLVTLPP